MKVISTGVLLSSPCRNSFHRDAIVLGSTSGLMFNESISLEEERRTDNESETVFEMLVMPNNSSRLVKNDPLWAIFLMLKL